MDLGRPSEDANFISRTRPRPTPRAVSYNIRQTLFFSVVDTQAAIPWGSFASWYVVCLTSYSPLAMHLAASPIRETERLRSRPHPGSLSLGALGRHFTQYRTTWGDLALLSWVPPLWLPGTPLGLSNPLIARIWDPGGDETCCG